MEDDSPLPSSQEFLLQRLALVGVPKECCSKRGLVEFVRANHQSMISELVSALLPTDEDVNAGLKEAMEKFRKPTMKKRLRESMNWLQWLMFQDDPAVSLKDLAKLNVDQRGVCGSVWGHNDIAYRCRTCENDPTCAICVPCFENGDHSSHDYSIIYTGGGCCDCGDETAWKREGFCSKHKGSEQIQPLSGDLAESVGPVLDALFACWYNKLLSAESIRDARSNDASSVVVQKMSNELTFVVVEMLLEFCKSSESLLSFVSRRIISSSGLLDILVKAERFLDQDAMKKLHDLFLKLIADPVFKSEFAKAFVSYYPLVVSEAVKQGDDNAFRKYPLLSTFSVQIFTVPTLTPFLVKEMNLLAMLLGCLSDIFLSCSGEDGVVQATKWERVCKTSDRVIDDLKFVLGHAAISKYATHEHRELSRSWLILLTFAQGMNPLKRESGIHIEEENEYMNLFFVLGHSIAVIHSLLVTGAYSAASDEEVENERITKVGLDTCDGDGERLAVLGGGKIVFIGGYTEVEGSSSINSTIVSASADVYEFDPASNSWRKLAGMNIPRYNFAFAVVNGLLYVIRGYSTDAYSLSNSEVYNPETNRWSLMDCPNRPVWRGFAFSFKSKLFAVGNGSRFIDIYDPKTETWQELDSEQSISVYSYTVVRNKVYFMDRNMPGRLGVFDPEENCWSSVGVPPRAGGFWFRLGEWNNKVLLFSRVCGHETLMYDLDKENGSKWRVCDQIKPSASHLTSVLINF